MKNDFCFGNLSSIFLKLPNAAAILKGSENYPQIKGSVMFYSTCGGVIVRSEIMGLPDDETECDNRIFAFHIHSGDSCQGNHSDFFADVGGHYNPNNCTHPYHADDMPPLFSVKGKALSVFLTDRFTLKEIIGKTVIIHGSPDDFTTQPSGNAGEKIACGVIQRI